MGIVSGNIALAWCFLSMVLLAVSFVVVVGVTDSSELDSKRQIDRSAAGPTTGKHLCPNVCRFYQVHWAGECNGIFHEATCPVTCGSSLQEVYDSRKLSHYVIDDWKRQDNDWRPFIDEINPKTRDHGKPDLGVAATCELYSQNNYRCYSTVLPPPVTQWAREALTKASNNTRTTTSPDLRHFCVCDLTCSKGLRVAKQIPRMGVTKCSCPSWVLDPRPDERLGRGYQEVIYNNTK